MVSKMRNSILSIGLFKTRKKIEQQQKIYRTKTYNEIVYCFFYSLFEMQLSKIKTRKKIYFKRKLIKIIL